jgi:hypothetical protein
MPHDKQEPREKREPATSKSPEPDDVLPPDVLARVIAGEPVEGFVPTLEERVKAAIAAAPYHAPKFRHIESTEWVLGAEGDVDVTQLSYEQLELQLRMLDAIDAAEEAGEDAVAWPSRRLPDQGRIRTAGPNVSPYALGERPHEFLARIARGEPIDGYLPPLKLRRIAAVAAARYYAATLRSVDLREEPTKVKPITDEEIDTEIERIDRRLAELRREEELENAEGASSGNDQ